MRMMVSGKMARPESGTQPMRILNFSAERAKKTLYPVNEDKTSRIGPLTLTRRRESFDQLESLPGNTPRQALTESPICGYTTRREHS